MQQVARNNILTWQFEVRVNRRGRGRGRSVPPQPSQSCTSPPPPHTSLSPGVKDDKNKGQKHGLVKGLNTLKNQQKITGSNLQQMLNERRGQWRTAVQSQEFFRTL